MKKKNKNPAYGALTKAWLGYKIAKAKGEIEKMKEYAMKINQLNGELGKPLENFAVLQN